MNCVKGVFTSNFPYCLGVIFSKKHPNYCLFPKPNGSRNVIGNGSKLGITTTCNISWLLTKDQKLRYGASILRLNVGEILSDPVVKMGRLYGKANILKWYFNAIEGVTAED